MLNGSTPNASSPSHHPINLYPKPTHSLKTHQIAVSLISDLVPTRFVPLAESLLYIGVYIGEAISARISAVFKDEGKTWRLAFKAIGITGLVIAVLTRGLIREPRNRRKIVLASVVGELRCQCINSIKIWRCGGGREFGWSTRIRTQVVEGKGRNDVGGELGPAVGGEDHIAWE